MTGARAGTVALAEATTTTAAAPIPRPGMRVRPAPRREPPFDDELFWTATGPLDQPLPLPLYATEPGPGPEPRVRPAGLSDPARWSRTLLLGLREVAAGHRPVAQLGTMVAPAVAAGLGAELNRIARLRRRHWAHAARVHSVHASEPADGVAEVCATVQAGERMHAVALRLEARQGRWWCTRLQLG